MKTWLRPTSNATRRRCTLCSARLYGGLQARSRGKTGDYRVYLYLNYTEDIARRGIRAHKIVAPREVTGARTTGRQARMCLDGSPRNVGIPFLHTWVNVRRKGKIPLYFGLAAGWPSVFLYDRQLRGIDFRVTYLPTYAHGLLFALLGAAVMIAIKSGESNKLKNSIAQSPTAKYLVTAKFFITAR